MKFHSAVFYSKNIEKLKPFYIDFLKLEVERESSGKFISFIFPNSERLGIKVGDKPRELGGHGTIFVEVDDINAWYEQAQSLKLTVYKKLTIQPWATSFSVLDPDGNKVEFLEGKNE